MDGLLDLVLDVLGEGLLVKVEDFLNVCVGLRANVGEPLLAEVNRDRRLLLGWVGSAPMSPSRFLQRLTAIAASSWVG